MNPELGNARKRPPIVVLDRATLWGMALGIACMLEPWWSFGFRVGFFATLVCTLAQIATSHALPKGEEGARDAA
jgi:hypothetical protein